jgi:hypothetical protein
VGTTKTTESAQEQQPDPIMSRIGEGIALSQAGDHRGAQLIFEDIWTALGPEGDPFHRCAVAHSMADVQTDAREELLWDQRALAAADAISDERARAGGVAGVQGFYPSLHLNLADVYLRLGEIERARDHLSAGQATVGALSDDGYGRMITDGLDRLAERINASADL